MSEKQVLESASGIEVDRCLTEEGVDVLDNIRWKKGECKIQESKCKKTNRKSRIGMVHFLMCQARWSSDWKVGSVPSEYSKYN